MGVARHQHLLVAFAELLEPVEERLHVVGRLPQLVAQEELQVDQHLIVARAARVDLLAHVAQSAGEQQLDLRVDVLGVRLDFESAGRDLAGDRLQSGRQRRQFVAGQQPDLLEHGDVRQRSFDIVAGQPQVQFAVAAHGVGLDRTVGFETLIPEFVRHGVP